MFIPMRQKVLNSDGRELKGQNFFILVGGGGGWSQRGEVAQSKKWGEVWTFCRATHFICAGIA